MGRAILSILLLTLLALPGRGYRDGAREESCYNMLAMHTDGNSSDVVLSQQCNNPCPFFLEVVAMVDYADNRMRIDGADLTTYECGQVYEVQITSSMNDFSGYLVEARETTVEFVNGSSIWGTWLHDASDPYHTVFCNRNETATEGPYPNAATQNDAINTMQVTLYWQAPPPHTTFEEYQRLPENITFWFTIVESLTTYYYPIKGPQLSRSCTDPLVVGAVPPLVRARNGTTATLTCISNADETAGIAYRWEKLGMVPSSSGLSSGFGSGLGVGSGLGGGSGDGGGTSGFSSGSEIGAGGMPTGSGLVPGSEVSSGGGTERLDFIFVSSGPTLEFNPVVFGDEGFYRCVATTPEGDETASNTVTVAVSPEGSVSVIPLFEAVTPGDNASFTCSAQGGPDNTYQWQLEGIDLPGQTLETINITNVTLADGGNYTCVVSNAGGSDNASASLLIPRVAVSPPELLSRNGSDRSFMCVAEDFQTTPATYRWGRIDSLTGFVTDLATTSSILTFNPVRFGDEGYYRCAANTTLSNGTTLEVVSRPARLTVSPEGSVEVFPTEIFATRNSTNTLTCSAQGGPENMFTWTRLSDMQDLVIATGPNISVVVQDEFDGDNYQCTVENEAGNDTATALLGVVPNFVTMPSPENVTRSDNFMLSCVFSAFPPLFFTNFLFWIHNGSEDMRVDITAEINDANRTLTSILTVQTAIPSDSGEYQCGVLNETEFAGLISMPITVLVQDTPEQPQNVTGQALNSTAISLTWAEPRDNNAPIQGYRIRYRQPPFLNGTEEELVVETEMASGTEEELMAETEMASGTEEELVVETEMATITDLHPGVTYRFTVVAFNEIGNSTASEEADVRTDEETPDAPPVNVQAMVDSSTTIMVTWEPVPEINRNGDITHYEVEFNQSRFTGIAMSNLTETEGPVLMLLLPNLQEDVEYQIRVRAYTSVGPGPYSSAVVNTTFEDVPADPPQNVQVQTISSTEIDVSWLPPPEINQNGNITTYEVEYEPLITFNGMIATNSVNTANGSVLQMTLTGLQEFVEYNITVRAYTGVGPGPFSMDVSTITLQDEPRIPPGNVQAVTLSSTAIRVTWSEIPEIDQNGIITTYEVEYEPLNTFDGMIETNYVNTTNGSVFEIVLENLEEDVDYNISVRGYTEIGPGPFSDPETSRTSEDEPDAPPQNVTAATLSSTEIQVSWEEVPAINQNGEIMLYEIQYTPLMTFAGDIVTDYVNTTNGSVLQLTLTGLQEFVEYNITVRAYTSVGAGPFSPVVSTTTLQDAPAAAPENVQTMNLSSTEIRVSWAPPPEIDQNGIIILYEIQYTPLMTFGRMIGTDYVNTTNGSVLQMTLTGLQEFVEYNITVRAYTSVGPGPFSPVVSDRTFEDEPAAAPQNIQTMILSSTEIRVSWTSPPEIDQNGIITVYEVRYEPLMTFGGMIATNVTNTTTGSMLEITLRELEEDVEYNISVRAYTSVGPGPYSPAVLNTTFEDVPDAPPQNVTTATLSSTEIRVSWEEVPAINQNGEITLYEIMYTPLMTFGGAIGTDYVNTTDGSVLDITLRRLQENVEYNISVRAFTSVGAGPFSPTVSNITLENAPFAAPDNVRAETLSSTEIRVSWTPPPEIDQNGVITVYEIEYTPLMTFGGMITTNSVNTTDGSVLQMILTGLQEFVEYNITVRAYTSVGPGPFSEPVSNTTFEAAPAVPPPNVNGEDDSPTSILVTWDELPPIHQNGIITQYEVEFNQSRFDEATLSNSTFTEMTRVDLEGLEEFVNYSIRVRALTSAGPGPFSTAIVVETQEAPPQEAPQNLTAITLSSTEILVSWTPPPEIEQNGDIVDYEVEYDPQTIFGGMIGTASMNTSDGSVLSITLGGLEENVEYNIRVRAYTNVGPGPYSFVVSNTTFEDTPAAPPQNVQTMILSSTEIFVSWASPPEIDRNGVIVNYEVEYDPQETFGGMIGTASMDTGDGSVLNITLSGLQENVEYSIRVRAYTRVGSGPYSTAVLDTTFEDEPDAPPQNVQTETLSSTEIRVSWEEVPAINQNGEITLYEIMYTPLMTFGGAIGTDYVNTTDGSVLRMTLTGLQEFVEYNITVRAYTSMGAGPFSPVVSTTTLQDAPAAAPENVRAETLSSTEIRVSWAPPPEFDQNGIIIQYEIQYTPLMTFDGMIATNSVNTANGSVLQMTLTGLQEFVEYNITVRAYTSVGPGPFSMDVSTITLQDEPRIPPGNVQAVTLSSTAIRVTWSEIPEIDQNGIITTYEVEYEPLNTFDGMIETNYVNTTNGSVFEIVLEDLEEDVDYNISVRGYTEVGPGPFSDPETSRTSEDEPGAPPQNVAAMTLSSTEIRVSWEEVPAINQNGEIVLYEIMYTPLLTFGGMIVTNYVNTTNGSVLQMTLTGLQEFVEYNITVRAYTSVGPGPFSPVVSDRTFEDEPAAAPENVQTVTLSSTEIRVSWAPPPEIDQNGIIILYEIQYTPLMTFGGAIGTNFVNTTNGAVLEMTLTGLQEFVEYNITVRAYTSVGPGPFSPVVPDRTFEDEPAAAPQNVQTVILSSTEIRVSWTPPPEIDQNGIITVYEVRYEPLMTFGGMIATNFRNTTTGSMLEITLRALEEDVEYNIRVRAYTSVGPGPYSPAVLNTTSEDEPDAPPQNAAAATLSSTEIRVSWEEVPAINQNGEIILYEVRYTPLMTFDGAIGTDFVNTTDVSVLRMTLTGLAGFVNYSISIRAYTIVGPGPYSPAVVNETFQDLPFTPEQPPTVPQDAISSTSVTLRWNPPRPLGGIINRYIVNLVVTGNLFRRKRQTGINADCVIGGDGGVNRDFSVPGDQTTLDVSDLTPFTDYEFQVQAETVVGLGDFSEPQSFSSSEDVPSEPLNLGVCYINSTALEVTWDRPLCDYGIRRGYTVTHDPLSSSLDPQGVQGMPNSPNDLSADATSLIITQLTPNTNYNVTVCAFTSVGCGNVSVMVNQTDEDAPGAISNLEVNSITDSDGPPNTVNVDITWDGPSRRNGLYGYNLTYFAEQLDPYPEPRRQTVSIQTASPIGDMQGRFTISDSNALPFANFSVTVFAFNLKRGMDVAGPPSSETHRTLAIAPTSVTNLMAVATSAQSIRVNWELPLSPNGPILRHIVYYLQSDTIQQPPIQSDNYASIQVDYPAMEATISGLIPFTNYSIHVMPVGGETGQSVLLGAIDEEILQRTNSTVPDEPPTLPADVEGTPGTSDGTIFINLPPPDQIVTGRVIFYAIVVFRGGLPAANQSVYDDAEPFPGRDGLYYITAAWAGGNVSLVPASFTVGDGSITFANGVTYINNGLQTGTVYSIFIRIDIESDNGEPLRVYSPYVTATTTEPDDPTGLAVGLTFGFLFLILVVAGIIVGAIWYRRRIGHFDFKRILKIGGVVASEDEPRAQQLQVITNPLAKVVHTGTHQPILVKDFANHVQELHSNDDYLFSEEYSAVEPDHAPLSEATYRPENQSKNRYANITAYDHSRVRLQETPSLGSSDYINANFIDGYTKQTNAYIASQGPLPTSVVDFWRMVWEQGVATIVMLTNLEERNRIKCHKYWPEEKSMVQGQIRVQVQETLTLANYTIRTFSLQKESSREERIVTQYHYTVWPDHGVPEYPTTLLHFVRKVATSNPMNGGPLLVHCSAGVGRTGTFIALDTQLRRIKAESNVDIFGFVRSMRFQRCFMVQTEPQYVFIHDALLEAIECGVTEVAARDLREQYRKLGLMDDAKGKTRLQIEFEKLDITVYHRPSTSISTLPVNKPKNRYANTDMLPYDRTRCRLSIIPGQQGSDYINGSHIDGYHKQKAFIATQGPLPDTTDDFWRMVWQQKCATIVMLTREMEAGRVRCHRYWPTSGAENYGQFQVILHTVNEYPDYTVREFKIVDSGDGSSLPVKQFHYTDWPERGVPDTGSGMIDLIGQVEKWQWNSGERPIIVHCSGGAGRTGTFIAVSILLERLKTEGVVDVFHTVRGLRLQRSGMVHTVDQYEFCYKTVLEFLDSFELYSNFK